MFQRQPARSLVRVMTHKSSLLTAAAAVAAGTGSHISIGNHAIHTAQRRCYASAEIPKETKAIIFERHGGSDNVLKKSTLPLPQELGMKEVLVKMLAAPINPADINVVEGNYGRLPETLPAVGGNEGVGQIVQVGRNVSLAKNQWVVPAHAGLGTWREYMVVNESDLIPISNEIPMEYAATITVNPSTALRLLNDFADLQEGDVIVQNGASSMVGLAVIQLARQRGIRTVNIIRERPDFEVTIDVLKKLGADIVVTEKYANTKEMRRLVSDLPDIKLGLNSVGGDSARQVVNLLGDGGVMVTYGGLSRKPITLTTSPFIFKDISCKGFWMTRWTEEHSRGERIEMIDELVDEIKNKKLILFMETHKFDNFDNALQAATGQSPEQRRKVVLKFE